MEIILDENEANPISKINELCQKELLKVTYTYSSNQDGNLFSCKAVLYDDTYRMEVNTQRYSTKKKCKNEAARLLLLRRLGWAPENLEKSQSDISTHKKHLDALNIEIPPTDINELNAVYVKRIKDITESYEHLKQLYQTAGK